MGVEDTKPQEIDGLRGLKVGKDGFKWSNLESVPMQGRKKTKVTPIRITLKNAGESLLRNAGGVYMCMGHGSRATVQGLLRCRAEILNGRLHTTYVVFLKDSLEESLECRCICGASKPNFYAKVVFSLLLAPRNADGAAY